MPSKGNSGYDPALAQLFASSIGPAQKPPATIQADNISSAKSLVPQGKEDTDNGISEEETAAESIPINEDAQDDRRSRKRKRKADDNDDVETRYMRQLALQEVNKGKQNTATRKGPEYRKGLDPEESQDAGTVNPDGAFKVVTVGESEDRDVGNEEPPQHETVASDPKDTEVEKAAKTVFLANIATSTITSRTAKKTLMNHLTSFFPSLAQKDVDHAIESFRFRSTAFAESGMPRKAAFIRQELMDTTTRSTNAYVVYTTQLAAREAVKRLNGTVILDRHLRVDSVAHPAKQDHRRSLFVGNLNFVDDTTNMDAAKDLESNSKPRKGKDPADVEEGLWRQFGKAGQVESVRVVRDKTTRVGKGFAYVQFSDANAVEKALSFNGKKFPPMLPRILRVTRAKSITKTKLGEDRSKHIGRKPAFNISANNESHELFKKPKASGGRAPKLLGRAGAAQSVKKYGGSVKVRRPTKSSNRRADSFKKKAKQKTT